MPADRPQLLAAIQALEAQHALLGDAVVGPAIAGLQAQLVALAPAPEPAQSLKQATILFLDVVGSTNFSQHLDPEQHYEVMDGALRRFTSVVEQHRGRVLNYAGDSVLAVFGGEESREDDAERAVLCGLALLGEGARVGAEIAATYRHPGFNVRVGAHTGPVLLGAGVGADPSIHGVAVNVAARMEQTAPAGCLRISQEVYAQVRGMFDVTPQEPLHVKGVDAPVVSYLVEKAKPRSFRIVARGIEGVATRMIGRDEELGTLEEAFRRVFRERTLAAVTVVGEAGIGKSRLLSEFEAWVEARPEAVVLFKGRATPQTEEQPYGLLRDLVAWRFQIADDESPATARAKLEEGLVPLYTAEDDATGNAHLLGQLIGIDFRESPHVRGILDDPRQIRNRAFHAAALAFRRLAERESSPVLLQLEDLHWADSESLDFLTYLLEVDRDVPMLLLSLARPTLFERRADWGGGAGPHDRVDLTPLDKGHSRDLANVLLQKLPEVPAALRELVIGGSEGNPFYMEELVRMLIDQGAIAVGPERWTLDPAKLLATRVPPTLTGVLQARLDRLPAGERETLQLASVIGATFWDRTLLAIDPRAERTLESLARRELLVPAPAVEADGLREYAFRHHLLHQVTYGTVLKRTRIDAHGKVARWLAEQTGYRVDDLLGVTAEHFEQAGEKALAAEYHARAAELACDRFAHDAVLKHAGRGIDLLEEIQPDRAVHLLRWRLLMARVKTLDTVAAREAQREDVALLVSLAEALDDDERRVLAAKRSRHFHKLTSAPEAIAEARRTVSLARCSRDPAIRLDAVYYAADILVDEHDLSGALQMLEGALDEARALGLRRNESDLLELMQIVTDRQHDLVGSIHTIEQALTISRELQDRAIEALCLGNRGSMLVKLGRFGEGRADLEQGLQLDRQMGDRLSESGSLSNLSAAVLRLGDDARALGLARSAADLARAAQSPLWEGFALVKLGDAELALGRLSGAKQAYEQARTTLAAIDDPIRYDTIAGLARVAMARQDLAAAKLQVESLLEADAAGDLGGLETPRLAEWVCFQVLDRLADPRAEHWLARAHGNVQEIAGKIPDDANRRSYLENIVEHREIVAAWGTRHREMRNPAAN